MKSILLAAALMAASNAMAVETKFETDRSLPIVYVTVVFDAGATTDAQDKLGLASLASRMLLRGTQKHSKNDFFTELNSIGGTIGVSTHAEGTEFTGAVLSENLDKFLELFEETLVRPKFTAEELAKLKKEVEGQILEAKSNDRELARHHFYRYFYGTHPYGNPDIGIRKTVAKIDHRDVVDFYSKHFGADTFAVFGSGDTDRAKIKAWADRLGERLAALHPEAKHVTGLTKPEIPSGRRTLIIDKPNATQAQVLMGGVGMRPEDPGFYAVQLANHSYGGGSFNARMMVEIRVKRGWTYGAYNSFRFGSQPRHYAMLIFPKTADTPPALNLTVKMFEEFVSGGITDAEFEFAHDSLVNNAPFLYNTAKKRIENAVQEHILKFPSGYYHDFASNIDGVSKAEVTPALMRAFKPQNLTLVVVGDASKLKEPLSKLPGFAKPVVKSFLED